MAIELTVEALTDELRGLVRREGKVGFIAGALPGESVRAERARTHRRYDEYRLLQVLRPSDERVVAPCPLVGSCGGCDLQHLAADAQLRRKTEALLGILERQAGLSPVVLDAPLRSRPFGYRRRARLAFYVPRRGAPRLGFREVGGKRIVEVARCPVLVAELETLPGRLAEVLRSLRQPRLVGHVELIRAEAASGKTFPLIHIHATAELGTEDLCALAELAREVDGYLSVRVRDGELRYVQQPCAGGPGYALPEFGVHLSFQPGDFLQGNADVNQALVQRVVDWLAAAPSRQVLEGFAGIGNFSLPLARRGFRVLALEGAADMVRRARANAAANGLAADFRVQDLTAVEPGLLGGVGSVLLDPPRAGALAFVQALAARPVDTVLYVSCSPPTLARDAAVLAAAGYRLARLCLVDMLPQTTHIESMCLFTRNR